MPMRFLSVDVFSDTALQGNQLAVFPHADAIAEEMLLPLTKEMHFSETVFLVTPVAGGDARLRIFTPAMELPFAGHPVLGAAVVTGRSLGRDVVRLETGAGIVPVELRDREGAATAPRLTQTVTNTEAFMHTEELS